MHPATPRLIDGERHQCIAGFDTMNCAANRLSGGGGVHPFLFRLESFLDSFAPDRIEPERTAVGQSQCEVGRAGGRCAALRGVRLSARPFLLARVPLAGPIRRRLAAGRR